MVLFCRAADYLVRTGAIVTLDVAKQGAIYHGLATLLQQPSPVVSRGGRKIIGVIGVGFGGLIEMVLIEYGD